MWVYSFPIVEETVFTLLYILGVFICVWVWLRVVHSVPFVYVSVPVPVSRCVL